jgi:hypothetical protein
MPYIISEKDEQNEQNNFIIFMKPMSASGGKRKTRKKIESINKDE